MKFFSKLPYAALLVAMPLIGQTLLMDFTVAERRRVDPSSQPTDRKNLTGAKIAWATEGSALTLVTELNGQGFATWRLDEWLDPQAPLFLVKGSVLTLRLKYSETVDRIAVRLRDAKGEYLQLKPKKVAQKNEWADLAWALDESQLAPPTWGDNVDGKIDFPVKEIFLAIDGNATMGLTLDRISVTTPEGWKDPLANGNGAEILNDFEGAAQKRLELPVEGTPEKKNLKWSRLSYATDKSATGLASLKLEGETEGSGYGLWDLGPFLPAGALERLAAGGELTVSAMSPDQSVRFALRLMDRDGENIQIKSVTPLATWGEARFSLTPENIAGVTWGQNTNRSIDTPLRSLKLAVDAKGPFTLYLDDLKSASAENKANESLKAELAKRQMADWARRVNLSVKAWPAFAVFTPDELPAFELSFDSANPITWKVSFYDTEGRRGPVKNISGDNNLRIPLPLEKFGPMALEITGEENGKVVYSRYAPYSIVHPISWKWKKGEAMLGICTHIEGRLDNWSDLKGNAGAEIARLYQKLGASHDRGELLSWAAVQNDAQTFNWERKDRVMKYIKDLGVRAMHIYAYTPYWASLAPDKIAGKGETWSRHMVPVGAWTNYLTQVALRYKDQIDIHELWNEPNIGFWKGSLEDFSTLANTGYQALKIADPGKPVVVGGYAQKDYDRIETLVKNTRGLPHGAFHAHGPFDELYPAWERYEKLFTANGYTADRLVNSETGMTTVAGSVTITNQAVALVKKLSHQLALGLMGVMWYDLLADGPLPAEGEHHYGIVAWDHTIKPAFAAYNHLISVLGGAKALQRVDMTQPVVTAQFTKGDELIAVIWNQKDKVDRTVRVDNFSGTARVLDMYGNQVGQVSAGEGLVVGPVPRYLMAKGKMPITLRSGRLVAEPMVGAPVGDWITLPVSWNENVGGLEMRLSGPGLEIPTESVVLPPGKGGQTVFRLRLTKAEATAGRLALFQNGREIESLGLRVTPAPRLKMLSAPLDPTVRATAKPDLVRETREYVKELLTWLGGNDNELWEGPSDLSGRLFAASDAKTFALMVEVNDSRTVEPEGDPADMWKADSLQLGVDGQNGKRLELGVSLRQGKVLTHVWSGPSDFTTASFTARAFRENGVTRYVVEIPLATLGRQGGDLITFSALVNDADKKARKQFLEFGSGIGNTKDPAQYLPWVLAK